MNKNDSRDDLRTLFRDLCGANERAFGLRSYSAAYHALAAALHAAVDLKDEDGLLRVEARAKEQLTWIDANDPDYEHSTLSASKRGNHSIFATLAAQAETREAMLVHERKYLNPGLG